MIVGPDPTNKLTYCYGWKLDLKRGLLSCSRASKALSRAQLLLNLQVSNVDLCSAVNSSQHANSSLTVQCPYTQDTCQPVKCLRLSSKWPVLQTWPEQVTVAWWRLIVSFSYTAAPRISVNAARNLIAVLAVHLTYHTPQRLYYRIAHVG